MTKQKLTELLRHAYQWGRDNGSNRSEKNFNDFLQIEAVQQALTITGVVGRSEQLVCDVCGSDDIIEAPSMGINCNSCNPL